MYDVNVNNKIEIGIKLRERQSVARIKINCNSSVFNNSATRVEFLSAVGEECLLCCLIIEWSNSGVKLPQLLHLAACIPTQLGKFQKTQVRECYLKAISLTRRVELEINCREKFTAVVWRFLIAGNVSNMRVEVNASRYANIAHRKNIQIHQN